MKIKTVRFGEIEVGEGDIIVMKGSILGFERLRRFILLIHDDHTPLWWLQAVDDPAVAFVVVNPRVVKPDYNPAVPEADLEFLDIRNKDDIALLAIVTVRMQPFGGDGQYQGANPDQCEKQKSRNRLFLMSPIIRFNTTFSATKGGFISDGDGSSPGPGRTVHCHGVIELPAMIRQDSIKENSCVPMPVR